MFDKQHENKNPLNAVTFMLFQLKVTAQLAGRRNAMGNRNEEIMFTSRVASHRIASATRFTDSSITYTPLLLNDEAKDRETGGGR